MADWTPNTWKNDEAPKINASNMNHLNDGIVAALDGLPKYERTTLTLKNVSNIDRNELIRDGHARQLNLCFNVSVNSWSGTAIATLDAADRPSTDLRICTIQRDSSDNICELDFVIHGSTGSVELANQSNSKLNGTFEGVFSWRID